MTSPVLEFQLPTFAHNEYYGFRPATEYVQALAKLARSGPDVVDEIDILPAHRRDLVAPLRREY
jgi:hypothetical protein